MSISRITETLPNGWHDAKIDSFHYDCLGAEAVFSLQILVGKPDDPPTERDRYEKGELRFAGVRYFAVELPDAKSSFLHAGPLWFSIDQTEQGLLPDPLIKALPIRTQCYSLFIQDWLAHIHVAFQEATFEWTSTGALAK